MKFRIPVWRTIRQISTVDVHADDKEEAQDKAMGQLIDISEAFHWRYDHTIGVGIVETEEKLLGKVRDMVAAKA